MRGGFTLVEIVIVMALMTGIMLLGIPFGAETYRDYVLTSTTRDIVSVLRRAETLALANASSSYYGVTFRMDRVVLFKGMTYGSRETAHDEEHILVPSVTVIAPSEVVFSPLSGMPRIIATITVGNGFRSQSIDVNAHGVILW
ncbi:MAG: prepilin-type N-terminal cleavage/methylation domain-containing protein [Candidatus Brennerbacteria bacterium]